MTPKTRNTYDEKRARGKFPERLKELAGDSETAKKLKDYLGVSIQTINSYKQGNLFPKTENLLQMAYFFGVPLDYLIGNSNVKSLDTSTLAIHKATGLSEESISTIMSLEQEKLQALNGLLQEKSFLSFLGTIASCSSLKGAQGNIIKAYMVSGLNQLAGNPDPYHLHNILKPVIDAGGDLYPMYRAKALEEAGIAFDDVIERGIDDGERS